MLVSRSAIEGVLLPEAYDLELVGYFTDWPDVKENTSRYLYRLVRS